MFIEKVSKIPSCIQKQRCTLQCVSTSWFSCLQFDSQWNCQVYLIAESWTCKYCRGIQLLSQCWGNSGEERRWRGWKGLSLRNCSLKHHSYKKVRFVQFKKLLEKLIDIEGPMATTDTQAWMLQFAFYWNDRVASTMWHPGFASPVWDSRPVTGFSS